MVDIWAYIAPVTEPGNLNGRPVGVTQSPGGDAIHQAQFDAPNSRRVLHTKGTHGVAADFEELYVEGDYVMRAIDTSRPARDGGPYTLHDTQSGRGSRWAKRHMALGEAFERAPYVSPFNMQTGVRGAAGGPHRTWLKLAAVHPKWRGVDDVIELWWLLLDPTQTSATEKYFYGRGLGLVGFEGPGLTTYPNHVWPALPPTANVPVLTRKALGFALPALPIESPPPPKPDVPVIKPGGFWVIHPCSLFAWQQTGDLDDHRSYGPHEGEDYWPTDGKTGHPVIAGQDGVVDRVDYNATGLGHFIVLRHDWTDGKTYYTWTGHLLEKSGFQVGAPVRMGDVVGKLGASGNSTGPHVHYIIQCPDGVDDVYWSGALDDVCDPSDFIVTEPPVTPPVTPEPPPIVTIPLPELSPDPAVRAQTVAVLRWLADIIEAAP